MVRVTCCLRLQDNTKSYQFGLWQRMVQSNTRHCSIRSAYLGNLFLALWKIRLAESILPSSISVRPHSCGTHNIISMQLELQWCIGWSFRGWSFRGSFQLCRNSASRQRPRRVGEGDEDVVDQHSKLKIPNLGEYSLEISSGRAQWWGLWKP